MKVLKKFTYVLSYLYLKYFPPVSFVIFLLVFFIPTRKIQAKNFKTLCCSSVQTLLPLHTENNFIYDSLGRVVMLRGVNVPANYYRSFIFSNQDLDIIKSFGFNFIRLGINWSYAEPKEGQYNLKYINNYKKFIKQAAKKNIYVMPEIHQVSWCMPDGAIPDWMCKEMADNTNFTKILKSADTFWLNNELQQKMITFWEFLVKNFKGLNNIFGYNIMNEPISSYGFIYGNFEKKYLFPFYKKVIQAIRKIDSNKPIILEPSGFSPMLSNYTEPFPFKNIIFSPHPYFLHGYDKNGKLQILDKESPENLQKKYKRYMEEAQRMKVPLLVGEFGAPQGYDFIEEWFKESLKLLDFYFISWAFWTYNPTDNTWSVIDEKRNIKSFYWKFLRRPYPVFTPGVPLSFSFSPDKKFFSYTFKPSKKAKGPAIIFIPKEIFNNAALNVSQEIKWNYLPKEQMLVLKKPEKEKEIHIEFNYK